MKNPLPSQISNATMPIKANAPTARALQVGLVVRCPPPAFVVGAWDDRSPTAFASKQAAQFSIEVAPQLVQIRRTVIATIVVQRAPCPPTLRQEATQQGGASQQPEGLMRPAAGLLITGRSGLTRS